MALDVVFMAPGCARPASRTLDLPVIQPHGGSRLEMHSAPLSEYDILLTHAAGQRRSELNLSSADHAQEPTPPPKKKTQRLACEVNKSGIILT